MTSPIARLQKRRGATRASILVALALLVVVPFCLWASAPGWWAQLQLLSTTKTPDDYAVVNQGQLKNIAHQAYLALKARGLVSADSELAGLWETPAASTDDYVAVNQGQVKEVARPFYDLLRSLGYTGQPVVAGQDYPWSGAGADDYALANIGQVKELFSFDLNFFQTLLGPDDGPIHLETDEIGTVNAHGWQTYADGVYTLAGSTGDIWSQADSLEFANQAMTGDGLLVVHVDGVTAADGWSKAGLMMRATLDAGSANVLIAVTPANGVTFQWRAATGGSSASTTRVGVTAPKWLALRRVGGTVAGYYSDDGQTWTLLGTAAFTTTSSVYAGLAYATHTATTTYGQATFDSISISPVAPSSWQVADIGAFGAGNIDQFTDDTMLINAGGGDIWNKSDSFRYHYQPLPADGRLIVRVASQGSANAWSKSGVMFRESTAANARYVMLMQTPGNGVSLQARSQDGAAAFLVNTLAGIVAPTWLKLERFGNIITASESADGATWTQVGSVSWGYGAALAGIANCSDNSAQANSALFDHISLQAFDGQRGWSASYFWGDELAAQPLCLRRDTTIDFTWPAGTAPAPGEPASNYSVRWQGTLLPATSGTCTFTVLTNGGVRLWVDGQLVIDRWAQQASPTEVSGQATLAAGSPVSAVVEYFNGSGDGRIQLRWSGPSLADTVLPPDFVRPVDSDSDGIPDDWESAHGLDPLNAADAALVPDADNLTNLAKYQLGLTPGSKADRAPGGAMMETWWGITDIYVWDLTNNTRFPDTPGTRTLLTSLEATPDRGDNYGDRIRGYIVPPADGSYQFWIAADDSAELWLSSDDSPFDRKRIAYVSSFTGYRDFDAHEIQRSAPVTLQAGRYYYFEVLHKEGTGDDNVSVAWTRPGAAREVIPGQYLATFAPRADNLAGDGLPDSWKTAHGLSLTTGAGNNGAYGDPDGDGLSNLLEYQNNSDPNVADTDGDGFSDLIEVMAGSDPADPASRPADMSPWVYGSVGSATGEAAGLVSGEGYVIHGGGWGVTEDDATDDSMSMAGQTLSTDFELSARVSDLWQGGQGGLAIRASLDPQAPAATFHIDTRGNAWFDVRSTAGGTTVLVKKVIISDVNPFLHGSWLRLRRQGRVITAFYSPDGESWIQLDTAELDLSDSCVVGMFSWGYTTWKFTHVSLQVDSNDDGVYDDQPASTYQQIVSGDDPMPAGTTLRTVASYDGDSGATSAGAWQTVGDVQVSQTPKSSLDFDIQVPSDGVYRLELQAESTTNPTLNRIFPVEISVDGQYLGRIELVMDPGQTALGHIATPWLTAGAHQVHVYYDSTLSYRPIQIDALRLQAVDGPDSDGNGRPDWVDDRLAFLNTLVPPVTDSFASPAFIEGLARYPAFMQVTAGGAPVTPLATPGYGWYADVPLSAAGAVPVAVSFENGAVTSDTQLTWKVLDLAADHSSDIPTGTLRIRKGDSLLLTVLPPQGAAQGASATIVIASGNQTVDTLELADPVSAPQAYRFDQPGLYTLAGAVGSNPAGSVQVEVVQADFNGDPYAGLGVVETWDNPLVPVGTPVDVDQGLSLTPSPLSGGGVSFQLLTANIDDSYAVTRLGEGGPILSRAIVHSLQVASDEDTADDVLTVYPDGSMLVGTPIILSQVTPDTRVVVDIIIGGVTFDDGTVEKVFTAADFDSLGRLYVKFLYSPGVSHSFCHRIYVYQGDTLIGEF